MGGRTPHTTRKDGGTDYELLSRTASRALLFRGLVFQAAGKRADAGRHPGDQHGGGREQNGVHSGDHGVRLPFRRVSLLRLRGEAVAARGAYRPIGLHRRGAVPGHSGAGSDTAGQAALRGADAAGIGHHGAVPQHATDGMPPPGDQHAPHGAGAAELSGGNPRLRRGRRLHGDGLGHLLPPLVSLDPVQRAGGGLLGDGIHRGRALPGTELPGLHRGGAIPGAGNPAGHLSRGENPAIQWQRAHSPAGQALPQGGSGSG